MNRYALCVLAFLSIIFTGLTGCEQDSTDDASWGIEKTISISKTDGISDKLYLDLGDGSTYNAADSTEWDLCLSAGTEILTNSGETSTAEGSGGTGGAAVYTPGTEYSDHAFTTDYSIYKVGMGGAKQSVTNIMSFPGYDSGDGTESSPYDDANFTASQYYFYDGMPPVYQMTDMVYVVRSGDGSTYGRFQVLSLEYSKVDTTTTYYFRIRYEKQAK